MQDDIFIVRYLINVHVKKIIKFSNNLLLYKMKKIYIVVGLLLLLGTYYVYRSSGASANGGVISLEDSGFETEGENIEVEEVHIYVDIAGAVNTPGVFIINSESIVNDVVEMAGGFSVDYDKSYVDQNVNLAQRVTDGQKIYIPYEGEVFLNTSNLGTVSSNGGALTNINTASLSELDALPSIGPATAQAIIDGRPYKKIDDLMEVKGIGESTFDKLKDKICV